MSSPSDIRVINDPETLRLIADPLRLRMLELLRQQPRTVTELANLLNVPRTKLYYHVKLLEEHELITVDATRIVSGIAERHYRVTAYRLSVDKAMLGSGPAEPASLGTYLSVMFDEVATEIQRAALAGLIDLDQTREDALKPRRLVIGRRWLRLTESDLAAFAERYSALQAEFADHAVFASALSDEVDHEGEGELYEWLVSFYPVVPPKANGND